MKNIAGIGITLIFGSLLAIAALALPPTPSGATSSRPAQASVQLQSTSGTIATVQHGSFTLVTGGAAAPGQQVQVDANSKTLMFVIDQNTTVDGKLQVGANAQVVYRMDNGNNMAVNVTVSK